MSLFEGGSYKAQYALIAYRLLMSRRPVCNQDVVIEFYKDYPEKIPSKIGNAEGYGELKKAVPEVIKAIRTKEGNESVL